VLPHAANLPAPQCTPRQAGAWYVPDNLKTGYEIRFTSYFYGPQPLCTLEEIRADILVLKKETEGLLRDIIGGETP
jgi:type I restriction enzyme M protein